MLPMEKMRLRAKAVSWGLGKAGNGMPQAGVEFEVNDGDHKGERINGYFALSDAAAEYTLEKLCNCGWTGTELHELDDPKASASMGANVVELVVEPEDQMKDGQVVLDDEGYVKQRLRIQFVNRGGGLAMKATMTGDEKSVLGLKMKAKLAAIRAKANRGNGGSGNGGPRGPTPPPPGLDEGGAQAPIDDIPF